jgi:hypothetical protein
LTSILAPTSPRPDLEAQRDLALNLRDLNGRVTNVIDRSEDLIGQLTSLVDNIRKNAPNEREALNEAEGALVELKKLRDEKLLRPIAGLGYRQYPRLREEVGSLSGSVSRTITRPTDSQARRTTELVTETGTVAEGTARHRGWTDREAECAPQEPAAHHRARGGDHVAGHGSGAK